MAATADPKLFKAAVQNEALAVLNLGKGIDQRQLKVQLTPATGRDAVTDFAARVVDGDEKLVQQFLSTSDAVSVWFQNQDAMFIFQTTLIKKRKSGLRGTELLMRWPREISILEERHHARYWVPTEFPLTGILEVLNPQRQVVARAAVRFWDVGLHGASIICPRQPSKIALANDDRLNVNFRQAKEEAFTLTAACRHIAPIAGGGLRIGVQFTPSPDPAAPAAQSALAQLVEHLRELCTGVPQSTGAARR